MLRAPRSLTDIDDADLAVLISQAIAALPDDGAWITLSNVARRLSRRARRSARKDERASDELIERVETTLRERELVEVRGDKARRRGRHFVAQGTEERQALALEFCALFAKGLIDKLALPERRHRHLRARPLLQHRARAHGRVSPPPGRGAARTRRGVRRRRRGAQPFHERSRNRDPIRHLGLMSATMAKTSKRGWQHGAAAVALAFFAAACAGGSGSSGFVSEAAVIQSVLDEGRCMDLDGIEMCPAGTAPAMPTQAPPSNTPTPTREASPPATDTPPLPAGTPTAAAGTPNPADTRTPPPSATAEPSATATDPPPATPTPTATVVPGTGIDVAQAPELSNDCAPATTAPCLTLQLVPRGFPPGAAFNLATRPVDSEGVWQIEPTTLNSDAPAAGEYDGVIALPSESQAGNDGSATALQIVVLAFFTDPGFLPDTVDRLSDAAADQAFALEPVEL